MRINALPLLLTIACSQAPTLAQIDSAARGRVSCGSIAEVRRNFSVCCNARSASNKLCAAAYDGAVRDVAARGTEPVDYRGAKVFTVHPRDAREWRVLETLSARYGLQTTGHATLRELRSMRVTTAVSLIALAPHAKRLEEDLVVARIPVAIDDLVVDLPEYADAEGGDCGDVYRPLELVDEWTASMASTYGQYGMQMFSIGETVEGREIHALHFMGVDHHPERPVVVINAGIHAREWLGVAALIHAMEDLFVGYANGDAAAVALLSKVRFLIIPVLNPDGYEFTWSDDRWWRKNRQHNDGSCRGIDLNRNGAHAWDSCEAPCVVETDPCGPYESYRGEHPLQAPEVIALANIFDQVPWIQGYVDVHTFSQFVMYPFAHTESDTPHHAMHVSTTDAMAEAMTNTHGVPYVAGQWSEILYHSAGTMMDHAYVERQVPHSYTLELRPASGDTEYFFDPPESEICPTADELRAGIEAMVEVVHDNWPCTKPGYQFDCIER